jgi:HSP20 family protein
VSFNNSKNKNQIIMTLVKFNKRPFERNFNNLFEDFFSDMPVLFKNDFNQPGLNGFAPVNIKENEKSYDLELVAPGFEKADFKINVDNDVLTISAEKKDEGKEENEKHIRKEYSYRSFTRSFTLDEKIDASTIDAKYVNGILTLNLPKKETVKPSVKEISIK